MQPCYWLNKLRIGKNCGSGFFANFARSKRPQTTKLITQLRWHITFCIDGFMTNSTAVGLSTSSQKYISAKNPPNFCHAIVHSGVAVCSPILSIKSLAWRSSTIQKMQRYLLPKRYLVLFLREISMRIRNTFVESLCKWRKGASFKQPGIEVM